jgi:RNA polymerase-binding transcription factor DksA
MTAPPPAPARPSRRDRSDHLTPDELEALAAVLTGGLDSLVAHLTGLEAQLQDLPASSAEAVAQRDLADLHAGRARDAIASTQAALERVAAGTYGRCTACGDPIPVERLRALPDAPFCVHCPRPRGLRR